MSEMTHSIWTHSQLHYQRSTLFFINQKVKMIGVEDILSNSEVILKTVGMQSLVDWEAFMRQNAEINALFDDLSRRVMQIRELQQRKFINTMKKLKAIDIPDLIKTVKAKKLPKMALKSILPQFSQQKGIIELVTSPDYLKREVQSLEGDYKKLHGSLVDLSRDMSRMISEKIQSLEEAELLAQQRARFPVELVSKIKSAIKIDYVPGTEYLTFDSYSQIVKGTKQLVSGEYQKTLFQGREKQRKLMQDPPKYLKAIKENVVFIDELIDSGQKALFSSFGVSPQKLEDLEVELIMKGYGQQLIQLQFDLRTQVKESIISDKQFSLAHAQEVLKYQIHIMETKGKYFKEIFRRFEITNKNIGIAPLVTAAILNDLVYEKYQIQDEDMSKHLTESVIQSDVFIMRLISRVHEAISKRMVDLNIMGNAVEQFVGLQEQYKDVFTKHPWLYGQMMANVNSIEALDIFHEKVALMQRKMK